MIDSKYEVLPFLPKTSLQPLASGITVVHPLTRRGKGPGLIVIVSQSGITGQSSLAIENGVPCPVMKWAEEGFTTVEITAAALDHATNALDIALDGLRNSHTIDSKGLVGLVAYDPQLWNKVASTIDTLNEIVGTVVYGDLEEQQALSQTSLPQLHHLAGKSEKLLPRGEKLTAYDYPNAESYLFAAPFSKDFKYSLESVSHSRNLSFFKPLTKGPYFDLEAIWDEHTYYEFENRSVECTMATMVQEPYVNHITTLTGGIGREALTAFYRDHFIFQNPDDVDTEVISRSIGIDRVIDEFIFKCTHDKQLDWLLPGVPPTGRKLEIPVVAVVNIRGDRLYHEHISWDQCTVLFQLGIMPDYLPFPHPVAGLTLKAASKGLEYRVPATGVETAQKLRNKDALGSNQMFDYKLREA
ncbi:unnamed protein product [Clonostachys rosea f. rosea IK726]|uniref:SnoaL-like domain-containing protein n=2 Tax=Bionectria ochroleuca TaxID=29856 RepID=A0A0B7KFH6_BIOOC|nr:unnamed protein product [Clonostachys rosea f. rosea IK726]